MKVVLLERVDNLGAIGDVVTVKDGFARNFLLPREKALRATSKNLEKFELDRAAIEARNEKNKDASQKIADKIDGQSYVMIRQAGETGQLYGSVAGRDVAEAIQAEGGKVERSQVVLNTAIKALGVHEVLVRLHPEVSATVKINVARSAEEAERQAKGEDVIKSAYDEDRELAAEQARDMVEGGAGQQDGLGSEA
jgi:large subunit ribosomal protein L9